MEGEASRTQGVLKKLVFYSVLMWLVPALLYYSTLNLKGTTQAPQTYGYIAVIAVNAVVVLYIVQAFKEKPSSQVEAGAKRD